MKRLLPVFLVFMLLLSLVLATVIPAFSDTEGTVMVTIESATVSVAVNPSSVSYGVVGQDKTGFVPSGDPTIFAQNTGNWWASFQIKGADTTGGWILSDTAETDAYVHYFGSMPQPPITPPGPVSYTKLTKNYQNLGGVSYSPYIGTGFKLKMDTPTYSAYMGTQNTTVTVMVTLEKEGLKFNLTPDHDTYTQGDGPVLLSGNVTNQDGVLVSGLTHFFLFVSQGNPPTPGIPPVIMHPIILTETGSGTGIYTGSVDISSLDKGIYNVGIITNDGTHFVGGGCPIEITS
jgi:hypothetical protein